MRGRNHFFLFIIIIFVLSAVLFWWRKVNTPEYFYTHKEIVLDFSNKKDISKEKEQFILDIVRSAQYSNAKILEEKKKLDHIVSLYEDHYQIRKHHQSILQKLSKKYDEKEIPSITDTLALLSFFDKLKSKIQIVPVRLTIAQAILESAWGKSRYALEGNSYFGIICYSEGCGLLMKDSDSPKYMKSYSSLQESVSDYMLFMNSKRGSRKFRLARSKYFSADEKKMHTLAESLTFYSEIGGQYQQILNDLFKNYIPDQIEEY